MAKDPKNFTGENVPGLLKAQAEHERMKDEWHMLGLLGAVMVAAVVFVLAAISVIGSLLR